MNYNQFYDNQERKVKNLLKGLNFQDKLIFGAFCLERNLANYYYFAIKQNFDDLHFLERIVSSIWQLASGKKKDILIANTLLSEFEKEEFLPHEEEDEESMWAIDTCDMALILIYYYIDGDDSHIWRISLLSIEIVEKWIYENIDYIDGENDNFDTKITSYDVMRREIENQYKVIKMLNEGSSPLEIKKFTESFEVSNIGYPIIRK